MASDDELKDEELLDFEESDYDIDGDYEELEEEEEEGGGIDAELQQNEPTAKEPADLLNAKLLDAEDQNLREKRSVAPKFCFPGANLPLGSVQAVLNSGGEIHDPASEVLDFPEAPEVTDDGVALAASSVSDSGNPESLKPVGSKVLESETEISNTRQAFPPTRQSIGEVVVITQNAKKDGSRITRLNDVTKITEAFEEITGRHDKAAFEEITGRHDKADGTTIHGPAPMISDVQNARHMLEYVDNRSGLLSSRPDLEDGELDETTAVMPSPQNPLSLNFNAFITFLF